MRGVVIQNKVQLPVRLSLRIDLLEELDPLLVTVERLMLLASGCLAEPRWEARDGTSVRRDRSSELHFPIFLPAKWL